MGLILITVAMESETVELRGALRNREDFTVREYLFSKGMIEDEEVLVLTTGVGMVASAMALAVALEHFDIRAVISQGTAGAHGRSLHTGDIVLCGMLFDTNTYRTPELPEGAGIKPEEWEFLSHDFHGEDDWRAPEPLLCDRKLLSCAERVPYEGRVITGVIGSGDTWNREVDRIKQLQRIFGTDCEEMEAYAVACVCKRYSVPCLALRVISNNEWLGEKFDLSAAGRAQDFTRALMRELKGF